MKDQINNISDSLHALADGQLDSKKREIVLSLLEKDAELRSDMCDIYRSKELIQAAYPLEDFNNKSVSTTSLNYAYFPKVASYFVAFILAIGAGYLVRDNNLLGNFHGVGFANTKLQENKVILFLSSSNPNKFVKTLAKAESLAIEFSKTGGQVYVVTSASGIDLLRTQVSPHQQKIKLLSNLYPALDFVACNNTLYRFKKEGKPIELIENTIVAPSAVEFVVKHMQQGWRYIAL